MRTIPIDEEMRKMGERDMQQAYDEFVNKHIERHKQEREREQKRDVEVSHAETGHLQTAKSPA